MNEKGGDISLHAQSCIEGASLHARGGDAIDWCSRQISAFTVHSDMYPNNTLSVRPPSWRYERVRRAKLFLQSNDRLMHDLESLMYQRTRRSVGKPSLDAKMNELTPPSHNPYRSPRLVYVSCPRTCPSINNTS